MASSPLFSAFWRSTPLPLALPWAGLPDSLDTLASMAARLQSVITLAFNHPVWAVVAVVFTIGLLQILADLVKRLIKSSVTFVLKLPLALSQWIWKRATTTTISTEAKIDQLICRLDTLRLEQDQTVAELKLLLLQSRKPKLDSVGLKKLIARSAEAEDNASTAESVSS